MSKTDSVHTVSSPAGVTPKRRDVSSVSDVSGGPGNPAPLMDKRKVASSFSRRAADYDTVAVLQRTVGERLLSFLPAKYKAESLLDLGCGTGYFAQQVADRTQASDYYLLDLAEGMLQYSRQQQRLVCNHRRQVHYLCADAEHLPLAPSSIVGLFSNLSIQWCQQPQQLFNGIRRLLRPQGWALVSTLGPGTLHELKQSWAEVDNHTHVNQFVPADALRAAIEETGLRIRLADTEPQVLWYSTLAPLARELKQLGAHNINTDHSQGLGGRRRWQLLQQAYEQFRSAEGLLPATYDVQYWLIEAD